MHYRRLFNNSLQSTFSYDRFNVRLVNPRVAIISVTYFSCFWERERITIGDERAR
ncbi:hypothetical protein PUN28_019112 [Cardiocondyla obscurior]|uniref:Uncharacterized protein n=1 Tax=Cardiocondyla obscurior TaxID=286306 RepID=A0AAW2EDI1_9HYME